MRSPAGGLAVGMLVDALVGDPRTAHPVAGFGRLAAALEARTHGDSRWRGFAHSALLLGAAVGVGRVVEAGSARRPALRLALTTAATWAVVGGTTLGREASALGAALEAGDIDAARERLPHLCGRDPALLDAPGLTRATVESVAENTSDAVVAPLFWGAVAGVPGLLGYRALNTLDAMIGHRSERYARFGWAAARGDDLANLLPARLTAGFACLLAPLVGGSPGAAWRVLRRDGAAHPSPNAGHCEAAFAGALGIRLGGTNVYGGRTEHRPGLGDGPPPGVPDIRRAVRLARAVGVTATGLAVAAGLPPRRGVRTGSRRDGSRAENGGWRTAPTISRAARA